MKTNQTIAALEQKTNTNDDRNKENQSISKNNIELQTTKNVFNNNIQDYIQTVKHLQNTNTNNNYNTQINPLIKLPRQELPKFNGKLIEFDSF